MYICSRSVCTSQEIELSCISALEVYVPSQESEVECVNAYELFTKQGNAVKSLFDNTESSGVHISVEGCTKIRNEIVTFFDSDNVIGAELKTPRKRTNSALSSTSNSVERQNKQTRIVLPPV